MSKIVWLRGTQIGREFELKGSTVTIGRAPENTVAVGSGRASRAHAEIRADAGGFLLVDLDSANGTYVNGQRLSEPYRLRVGDLFEIGDELFRFEAPEPFAVTTVHPPGDMSQQKPPSTPPPSPSKPRSSQPSGAPGRPAPPIRPPAGQPRRLNTTSMIVIGGIILILVMLLLWALLGGGGAGPPALSSIIAPRAAQIAPSSPASWTVLVYMAGDNDLEADAVRDMNEMEQAGSDGNVQVIVQFDRAGRAGDGERWSSTRRYLVARDEDPVQITSPFLEDLGELNTGDAQTLADFITWGVRSYPAERYALVIWDHGSAWAGVAGDTTSAGDTLSMPELEQALNTAQLQLDGTRLALIGFDACLMAQVDVLLSVAPYGDTAVASAELIPNDGWDWRAWIERLKADPQQDGPAAARAAVETYRDYYSGRNIQTTTLTAFSLAELPNLSDRTGAFADAAAAEIDSAYRALAEARSYATVYSQPRPEEFSAVDLGDLARLTVERGAPEGVASPARALSESIAQSQIAFWAGSFHTGASGVTVFFPQAAELLPDAYDQLSPLARQTSWARFLRIYYAAGIAQVAAPQIANLSAEAIPEGGVALNGTVIGREIATIFFFVGIPNPQRTGVQLIDVAYMAPPDSGATPAWSAVPHALRETWPATQWNLNAGGGPVPIMLGPIRADSDLYGVEGRYEAPGGDGPIDAALIFRVDGDQATLQTVYGFQRGQNQEAQPFEISPQPGDRFTVQFRTYTVEGEQLTPGRTNGQTLTFGDQPLQAVRRPMAPGSYVAGFLVRDIAGRFSYAYEDIRVAGQ